MILQPPSSAYQLLVLPSLPCQPQALDPLGWVWGGALKRPGGQHQPQRKRNEWGPIVFCSLSTGYSSERAAWGLIRFLEPSDAQEHGHQCQSPLAVVPSSVSGTSLSSLKWGMELGGRVR